MQINLLLREIPGITLFENIPTIMFPMIWFETYTQLPGNELQGSGAVSAAATAAGNRNVLYKP